MGFDQQLDYSSWDIQPHFCHIYQLHILQVFICFFKVYLND